ncbi:MAG TPA: hypothetical protein VNG73_11165 [Gemmatimonadaceae bacterium]|nr:hypothetical protein [Gemmatimonadaceae bacterium]
MSASSSVVQVFEYKLHEVIRYDPATWWNEPIVHRESWQRLNVSSRELDVRNCVAGPWHHYDKDPTPGQLYTTTLSTEATMGSLRFIIDLTDLRVHDSATGRWWSAASFSSIYSITAVPAARRILVVTNERKLMAYDVDSGRTFPCP